jgi:dipeptidyl aminopeptidase/acylaminoacyl peptidase
MTPPRRVVVADLAELRWAMEPALHPSTGAVAYVVSGPDRHVDGLGYELFVANGLGDEARLFERGARAPRWSPDGGRIAFLLRSGPRWTPACRTVAGDEVALSSPPGDVVQLDWSPDGRSLLAVVSRVPEVGSGDRPYRVESSGDWAPVSRRELWALAPDTDAQPLADLGNVTAARWSPDASRIAVVTDRDVDRDASIATGLWIHDIGSGASECLVPPMTPIRNLAWSPDGSSIAYLAATRDNAASALSELWVLDVSTLARRRLATGLDRSVGLPVRGDDERAIGVPIIEWTADSGSLFAIYASDGRSRLARFDLRGGWEDVIADERCVLEFSLGESVIAFSWSDPVTPGEVSLLDRQTGTVASVSSVSGALTSQLELAPTTPISIVASDGVEVEGWLTVPIDRPRGAPLVLQVHGGPHYPVGERFSFDAQRLAAQGLALLRANPRGSQGYGQAFADGILGDWGGRDLLDLLELVEQAVRTADLDTERVAIIGESYGGYIALWAAATTQRFSAAVVESGIADFLSSAVGVIGRTFWYSEMAGAPWENPKPYLDRSAITRIDGVTAPVLLIHCEADTTCPITHAEGIHAALRALGRDVEFLRVPAEGHFFNVFGSLSRRLERTATLDAFLVEHLQPGTPSTNTDREEIAS